MYAHSMPKDDNRPPVDFEVEGLHLDNTPRIHYWRKHPNLHGWMAGRYYEKGGTDEMGRLLQALAAMQEQLRQLVSDVRALLKG